MRTAHATRPSIPALVLAAVLVGQLGWLGAPPAARASVPTLAVDRFDDDPAASACVDGVPADCSLRGAVLNANADQEAEVETIVVPAGTYVLTNLGGGPGGGSLDVNWSASIVGAGSGSTIIDGNGTDRAFLLSRPPFIGGINVVSVTGLTVRNGNSCAGEAYGGGGMFISGVVTLTDVVFEGNTTEGCNSGGALAAYPGSTITIQDAVFRGNRAMSGGAMALGASAVTMTDTVIELNAAVAGSGGGIVDEGGSYRGTLGLTRVVIARNTASAGGGGFRSDSAVTLTDTTIDSNMAVGSSGGGINQPAGSIVATRTTISRNSGFASGGGIAAGTGVSGAALTIVNSTISDNTARFYTSGTPQYFGGNGGGIFGQFSDMTIVNSTITGNVAESNPGDSGHAGNPGHAGGINTGGTNYYGQYPTVTIRNSIIAGNSAAYEPQSQCQFNGATFAGSSSILGNGCQVAGTGNQNVDPALGGLGDNGGYTETRAPLEGSPAIDSGDAASCPATDQRGEPRPSGAGCDAGAYEVQVAAPPTPEPTIVPTPDPTVAPTPAPTAEPTVAPTAPVLETPAPSGTPIPTQPPLPTPMPSPSAQPTVPPPAPLSVSVADITVVEGNAGSTPATFTVRLSRATDTTVFVSVVTANETARAGVDYAPVGPMQLAFEPGQVERTVAVQVVGDAVRELPETFELRLQEPFGVTIADAAATATIREPALGPFHANATGSDLVNAYLLALLSHYVYEPNAMSGTSLGGFEDAFEAWFSDPSAGVEVTGFVDVAGTEGAYVETADALIVVMRGTEPPAWNDDAADAIVDGLIPQVSGIHSGFLAAASIVLPDVRARAIAARSSGKHVWLTGHSLGAAIATVLAYQLQLGGVEVQGLHTFGSPRVFSPEVAASFNLLFAARPAVRWTDNLDPVTHLPPAVLTSYAHVGITDNIVPGTTSGGSCLLQLNAAERLAGADFADHESARYIARIYENLASNADRSAVADPPTDPASAHMRAGCDVQPMTALEALQAAKAAGKDALAAAKLLAWHYGMRTGSAVAEKLLAVGYKATQIAIALRDVFSWGAGQVTDALKALKVTARDITAALAEAFLLPFDKIAFWLERSGFDATAVTDALRFALGASIDAAARALAYARYTGAEAVAALQSVFGYGVQATIDALIRAGFPADALVAGMQVAYGLGADAIARVLYLAGVSADKVGAILANPFGFGANLVAATLKGAGFFVSHIAAHLRTGFNLTAIEVAVILKSVGFDAPAVMTALRDAFSKGASAAADVLQRVRFTATETLTALKSVFSTSAQAGADILKDVRYTAVQSMLALRDVFAKAADEAASIAAEAGYTATAIGSALKNSFGQGAQAVSDILADCGFAATEIAGALQGVFSRTASQVVSILRSSGFAALEAAGAVKAVFGTTAAQVVSMLKSAGYTVTQVAAALKSVYSTTASAAITLLKSAGYSVTSVATALKDAYGRTASQVVTLLKAAAYSVTDVAKALANAFAMTASQVALTLWNSGLYAIDQIISALRSVFNLSLAAAYQVMRDLGLVP